MSALLQDLRYSLRLYRKSPGFAVVALLALAFGIGVNSAIFTLLNAIALRPLPLRNAGEVATVYQINRGLKSRNVHGSGAFLSYSEYQAYRDQNHTFSGLVAYSGAELSLAGSRSRTLHGNLVTCNYFTVLTGDLPLGRGFRDDECGAPGANPVVVIGYNLWQSDFAGDAAVLGKTVVLNRVSFTIIGVAPEGFSGASLFGSAIWAPITMQAQWLPGNQFLNQDNLSWLEVAGRLKPDTGLAAARADLAVIAARIDQQQPGRTTRLVIDKATLMNLPEGRLPVLGVGAVILAAVSLVLLIACANLANLLLARASARQKEIAVRLAVGASRGRLILQLLTESVVVALAGGALGVLTAWWTLRAIVPLIISKLPAEVSSVRLDLTPDPRILLYSLLLAFATGIGFGLLPALQSSRLDLNSALKESIPGFGGASRGRLRGALVAVQIAVCLVLLIAAGLLARGLQAAQNTDPGFALKDIAYAEFDLTRQGYDLARAALFHRQLAERLAATAGVEEIVQLDPLPLSGSRHGSMAYADGKTDRRQVSNTNVSAAFFRTLGVPVIRGRSFEERETHGTPRVVMLSETAARHLFSGVDPIGRNLRMGDDSTLQIIGIVPDIHTISLSSTDGDFIYFPIGAKSELGLKLMVRGRSGAAALEKAIAREATTLDPNILVTTGKLENNLDLWKLPARILSILAAVLGGAGLLLASIGIYGVMAYAVSQRTREIGIRMTLGAESKDVLLLVLRQSFRPVAIGVAVGLCGCAAVSRVLSSLLFGVSPLDPLVFGAVSIFLAGIAMLASYLPARRAAQVDPMSALRHQ